MYSYNFTLKLRKHLDIFPVYTRKYFNEIVSEYQTDEE
jgi:hypothetical protein